MSKTDRTLISGIGFLLLVLVIANFLIVREQQKALGTLIDGAAVSVEFERGQETKLWDLHRRIEALEKEDERLMSHIKWFVMRRSGTNELRKMEAVVARLEAAE